MLDHIFLSVADTSRSIAFYTAAMQPLGITQRLDYDGKDGPPGPRLHYDPRYYAANVFDLDGYSLEFVFKSWQH